MDKEYASYKEYEAINYGRWGLVFWKGREFDTFSHPPGQSFQTSFEVWLDLLPSDMVR